MTTSRVPVSAAPASQPGATSTSTPEPIAAPMASPIPISGIVVLTIAEFIFTLFLGYALISFWPMDAPVNGQIPAVTDAFFFGSTIHMFTEARFMLAVFFIGALGSQVRNLRSMYWYVGNRTLVWSWTAMYIINPLVGGLLGLIFYFVIRAGFFSAGANLQVANPLGFVALAALAGMFSEQAVLKLKDVAETLLTKPEKGKDSTPPTEEKGKESPAAAAEKPKEESTPPAATPTPATTPSPAAVPTEPSPPPAAGN